LGSIAVPEGRSPAGAQLRSGPTPGSSLPAPSNTSTSQRVSLHCVLSVSSPVVIASSMRRPVTGLEAERISRTIASTTCVLIPSCGR
jgi:hypothetical protein